jgi:hypothetical protein
LAEGCQELTELWFTGLSDPRQHATAFLSAIEEITLHAKRIIAIEVSDEYFAVISVRLYRPCDRLRFATEAARILELAGVPNVFAGASLDPEETVRIEDK